MKLKRFYLYLLLGVIGLSACVNDEYNTEQNRAGTILLTLVTSEDPAPSQTRSMQERGISLGDNSLNENTIQSLQLFFFDKKGDLIWEPDPSLVSKKGNGQVEIPVPSMKLRAELSREEVQVYALVNYRLLGVSNVEDILNHKVTSDEIKEQKHPDTFIMLGHSLNTIRFVGNSHHIGNVYLKRLVAKIEAKYPIIPAEGIRVYNKLGEPRYYKPIGPKAVRVMLTPFYASGYIDSSKILQKENPALSTPTQQVVKKNKGIIFYTYPAQWGEHEEGVNLVYSIQLRCEETGEEREFHYRVPVAGDKAINPETHNKLLSNYYYSITPRIGKEGGDVSRSPVKVQANFTVAEWTTKVLDTSIDQVHFFMLKEHQVYIANAKHYKLEFVASSDVEIASIDKVWYWAWRTKEEGKKDLESYQKEIPEGSEEYPSFRINNHTNPKTIEIYSPIPRNFSPRYIEVTFKDQHGVTEKLQVEQYPARFITGERSKEEDKDFRVFYAHDNNPSPHAQNQNNFNLFTVTTLAGGEEFNGKKYKTGDPTYIKNGKIYTYEDKEHNQLISPRFVIASQRSIYDRVMYNRSYKYGRRYIMSARERCESYAEGGYEVGTWRLPTEAEIEYLNALQSDPYSPVRELFKGANYWSAATYRYFIFQRINDYEGQEGLFGSYNEPTSDYKNDSYSIYGGSLIPVDYTSLSVPNSFLYVDPSGADSYRQWSSKFYYSAYVRCVRDI